MRKVAEGGGNQQSSKSCSWSVRFLNANGGGGGFDRLSGEGVIGGRVPSFFNVRRA